ncbi:MULTISPECIES: copper resistance CopC family protein [Citricoccus]|uniref:copper resistance CopC family protein n=1 Tax=Citricoccus TaxID=169133 RepID=UPI000255E171|nr:copper resistance CopC family protein [Citricoccus sp. CH26A]
MNPPVSPLHPALDADASTARTARAARSATDRTAGIRPAGRRRAPGRHLGGVTAATLLALSAATAAAPPALAHDQLLSTTPEAGATVTAAPAELSLTFSGTLITGQGIQNLVTVTDEAGHQWQDGAAQVTGPELTSALCEGMPNGDYDVAYRVVYSDGHSEAKQYGFTVDDPSAPDTAVPQDCGVPNPDAPVGSGEEATSADAASPGGATGDAASADPGAEPAPATLDTPGTTGTTGAPDTAGPADGQATAADSATAETAGDAVPTWVWVLGILGVLIVAAAVVLVFRRARAIDGASGGRPGAEG